MPTPPPPPHIVDALRAELQRQHERLAARASTPSEIALELAARNVSQRIKAEFHAEDLYLAYQVFGVDSWSQILSDSTPEARLDASARKLCEALGMRHDRWAWVAAAKIALALKSGWVNKQGASASTPGCSATIDNRLVWRAALGSVSFPPGGALLSGNLGRHRSH